MAVLADIEIEYQSLYPYASTAREVMQGEGLTPEQELRALRLIPRVCPWFSKDVYARACWAVGQVSEGLA